MFDEYSGKEKRGRELNVHERWNENNKKKKKENVIVTR